MSKKQNIVTVVAIILSVVLLMMLVRALLGGLNNILVFLRGSSVFLFIHYIFYLIASKIKFKKIVFVPFVFFLALAIIFLGQLLFIDFTVTDGFGEALAVGLGMISLALSLVSYLVSFLIHKKIILNVIISDKIRSYLLIIATFLVVFIGFQYYYLLQDLQGIDISFNYYLLLLIGSTITSLLFLIVLKGKYEKIKMVILILPFLVVFVFSISSIEGITLLFLSSISYLFLVLLKPYFVLKQSKISD